VPNPARRSAVIGRFDFDATVQMDHALAMLVVVEKFQGQGKQGGFFFGKHGSDLPFGGAVDASIGAVDFPTVQIGLRFLQTLEVFSL